MSKLIAKTSSESVDTSFNSDKKLEKVSYKKLNYDYKQLDYIQSSGTQYINTKLIANTDFDELEISFAPTTLTKTLNSVLASTNGSVYWILRVNNNSTINMYTGTGSAWNGTLDTSKHTVKVIHPTATTTRVSWDGGSYSTAYSGSLSTRALFLFNQNNNSDSPASDCYGSHRVYYLKCKKYGLTTRNFTPAMRVSDSVIGLYDTVNCKFYPNNGSGTFSYGSAVSDYVEEETECKLRDTDYKQLDYIQTSGTQWIDTGVDSSSVDKVSTKLMFDSFYDDNHFLGGRQKASAGFKEYIGVSPSNSYKWFDGLSTSSSGAMNRSYSTSVASLNTLYEIESTNLSGHQMLKVNGEIQINTLKTSSDDITYRCSLFAWNGAGTRSACFRGKTYYVILYGGGKIVRYFLPAMRKSDSVVGLYDQVEHKFYANSGSGTFAYGSVVKDYVECYEGLSVAEDTVEGQKTLIEKDVDGLSLYDSYNSSNKVSSVQLCIEDTNYKQLDYIQSSGTQYIDTDVSHSASKKFIFDLDLEWTSLSPSYQIFGWTGNAGCGMGVTSSSVWWNSSISAAVNTRYSAKYVKNGSSYSYTVDGTTYSSTSSASLTSSAYLFAVQQSVSSTTTYHYCYQKLYNASIRVGDALVRNFVPALRKSDNVVGLYDKCTRTFFENLGSGTFSYGSVVSNSIKTYYDLYKYLDEEYITTAITLAARQRFSYSDGVIISDTFSDLIRPVEFSIYENDTNGITNNAVYFYVYGLNASTGEWDVLKYYAMNTVARGTITFTVDTDQYYTQFKAYQGGRSDLLVDLGPLTLNKYYKKKPSYLYKMSAISQDGFTCVSKGFTNSYVPYDRSESTAITGSVICYYGGTYGNYYWAWSMTSINFPKKLKVKKVRYLVSWTGSSGDAQIYGVLHNQVVPNNATSACSAWTCAVNNGSETIVEIADGVECYGIGMFFGTGGYYTYNTQITGISIKEIEVLEWEEV